jgi:hypothetical protein
MTPTYMMQCAFGLMPLATFVGMACILVKHRRMIEALQGEVEKLKQGVGAPTDTVWEAFMQNAMEDGE